MMGKKSQLWLWLGVTGLLVVTGLAVIYGQGQLNLGALGVKPEKVSRVAIVECPTGSVQQDKFCIFTMEPLEYYVIKDGDNFVIHGPKITETYRAMGWNFQEGAIFHGDAYSVSKLGFTMMEVKFKLLERGGQKVPSFVFDYATAQQIQGSRFVEVELSDSTKLRFNTFNIPDKNLKNQ